ncbi:MAG: L-rhamnose mutarotase [Phycisphaeraceae bacterium]|nr:L-rhamnose mutarotase [Phycisphaeraceae bacterium]
MEESPQKGYLQKAFEVPVKRYCMTMELENDPQLIEEYKEWHTKVWPEVLEGIKKVGILDHEIYLHENKLFMIVVTPADFDFETQMSKLAKLPRQAEWEEFMSKFQVTSPDASSAEKWVKMERIFKLQ